MTTAPGPGRTTQGPRRWEVMLEVPRQGGGHPTSWPRVEQQVLRLDAEYVLDRETQLRVPIDLSGVLVVHPGEAWDLRGDGHVPRVADPGRLVDIGGAATVEEDLNRVLAAVALSDRDAGLGAVRGGYTVRKATTSGRSWYSSQALR